VASTSSGGIDRSAAGGQDLGVSGRVGDRATAPAPDRRPAPQPAGLAEGVAAARGRSPAAVLALQRAAGNAATMRALGLQRRPARRLLQRAPVHLVLGLEPRYFYGLNNLNGVSLFGGMPAGYHVTIYPELNEVQKFAGLAEVQIDRLPDHRSIQFREFNVTGPTRAHYYFDDQGKVVWKRTKSEASLHDADWETAIKAARVIYGALQLDISAQSLYDQLHVMGRTERVCASDMYGRTAPKPVAQPRVPTGKPQGMVPAHLRRGRPAGAPPPPVTQAVPAPAPAQPAPAQPAQNPFRFQPFVRAGELWTGGEPQQLPAQLAPQPFAAPPAAAPAAPWAAPIWPAPGGANPFAFMPVFEHPDEMDTSDY
jgi:hypothetical protein